MTDRYEQFKAANDEKTCLGVMMKLRQGGAAGKCPACGRRSQFEPNVKHRAYTCASCGHAVYPCEGTPLEALRTPLALWFYAIKALVEAGPDQVARRLERDAGVPRTAARRMERDLAEVAGDARSLWPDWLVALGTRVTAAPGQATAPDPAAPAALAKQTVNPPQAAPPVAAAARAVPPVRAFSTLGQPPPARQLGVAAMGHAHGPAPKADGAAKPRQSARPELASKPSNAASKFPSPAKPGQPGQAGTSQAGLAAGAVAEAGRGASPAAMRPAPVQAAPREHAYLLPIVAGALLLGLAVAGGFAFYGWKAPDGHGDSDAPELALAPAHPSLILSAVEEDLEAAREAVEFALENDASLGQQQPLDQADTQPGAQGDDQGDAQSDIDLPPVADLPRAPVTIPSVRLPTGTPLRPGPGQSSLPVPPAEPTVPRQPSEPPMVANGDPNQVLTFGPIKIRRHIVDTIVRAARVVGADPSLLMAVADKESSFATEVKAKTSSATGLYQFIESTWLGVIYEFGAKHGLKERASITRNGRQFVVNDPTERARILDLPARTVPVGPARRRDAEARYAAPGKEPRPSFDRGRDLPHPLPRPRRGRNLHRQARRAAEPGGGRSAAAAGPGQPTDLLRQRRWPDQDAVGGRGTPQVRRHDQGAARSLPGGEGRAAAACDQGQAVTGGRFGAHGGCAFGASFRSFKSEKVVQRFKVAHVLSDDAGSVSSA